jgi:flagellar hook-basal body complex protein FliE
MNIPSTLNGILSPRPPTGGNSTQPQAAPGADFGSMLKDAIGSLSSLGAKADESSLKLATGQPVDIHEVMLNTEQASLGFQVALQVRNKLVDAYSEIMRMSV